MTKPNLNIVRKFILSYKDNPYSLGASIVDTHEKYAELRYKTSYDREQSYKKLRKAGIPAKLMSKNMERKGYMYRYTLNVWYS